MLLAAAVLAMWTAAAEARLVYLQVVQRDKWVGLAADQQFVLQAVPGRRGDIVDRRGAPLALTAEVPTVAARTREVKDPVAAVAALCAALRDCSAEARRRFVSSLNNKFYARLSRKITPAQAARVAALKLDGFYFEMEPKRFYPNGSLAAHLIGYANDEFEGQSGVEGKFQRHIGGQAGKVLVHRDGGQVEFATDVITAPTAGASLELTIDRNIQHIAERELKAALDAHDASAGTAIVMDPWTNELLAFANYPTFDPNHPKRSTPEDKVNRGVQYVYEPGSTLKLVTASAALELQIFDSSDIIDVSAGEIRFGRDVIRDDHRSGPLSVTDVIVKSSNVGAARMALSLGAERLVQYVRKFGFGLRLSPDFGGESAGKVWEAADLNKPAELARVAMGYQISVTPLQMAAAVSAIANGGELLEPHLVRAFIKDGKRHDVPKVVLNRSVDAATAAEMTTIMERVVTDGTGTAAQVPGYTVAGKTGTAQKLIDGAYSKTHYVASFVGFVPSRNPKYTIIVVVDSPRGRKGYYGGTVAAPAFRRIAEDVLRYSGVPPTLNAPPPVMVRRGADVPHEVRTSGPSAGSVATRATVSDSTFPDFTGVSAREALVTLTRLGMTTKLRGSGLVVDQRPAPGTPLEAGGVATLWLDRGSPVVSRVADSSPR
jgi:cell division protein FtsI (penicillin-binding protein 3)